MNIDWVSIISGLVSGLIAGGGIVGLFVKHLGQKWIDERFHKSRLKLQHENQREIERLKGVVQGYIDHQTRLNTQEFNALTQTYNSMYEAVVEAQSALAIFSRSDSILGVNEKVKKHIMETNGLIDIEIEFVFEKSSDFEMDSAFRTILFRRKVRYARILCQNFGDTLNKNSIFIDSEILKELREVHKLSSCALFERMNADDVPGILPVEQDKFRSQITSLLENVELQIRKRIWDRQI
ncbi:hypothetical protein [Asticcacaulis endophyticus]|uniref:Uncharacterized protein n=1 Tax=Asticcacaulis endophyticus TaxID=1395890 RepID=A0A918UT46_9CAUL|nr:hypothetical protein [Asticcacaulis endophyticus]GGZ32071.1 hypothetical protein GCM10011273_17650 [Asticcacaulis endophyticus]